MRDYIATTKSSDCSNKYDEPHSIYILQTHKYINGHITCVHIHVCSVCKLPAIHTSQIGGNLFATSVVIRCHIIDKCVSLVNITVNI